MTTLSSQNLPVSYNPKGLCRIVGFACLAGFVVDLLTLTFPPAFGSLEWRIGFLQQLGDRAVIFLFGLALVMYGIVENRRLRRQLALFCLVIGVFFNLSCVLVIRDHLTYQQQSMTAITQRATDLQTQIQNAQSKPNPNQKVTPEQLQEASKQLTAQAESLKQNAKTTSLKTAVSSVGNLVVVGLALIGLGQYGARPSRN